MTPRFEPQDGASAVLAHPHRFTLQGEPGSLEFPALCPNCGNAAASKIDYSKVFRRTDSDSPNTYIVSSVAVPFCDACIASHHARTPVPTLLGKVLSSFATAEMFGAVFPGLAAVFVVYLAIKDLFNGQLARSAIMLVLALFFGLIAWYQRRHVWRQTEHLRIVPQSDVTQAFDFSDDVAPAFEPARFVCTMRDGRFADAFELLNRERRWVRGSLAAIAQRREANRKAWIIGGIVAAIALAGLIIDWLG